MKKLEYYTTRKYKFSGNDIVKIIVIKYMFLPWFSVNVILSTCNQYFLMQQ